MKKWIILFIILFSINISQAEENLKVFSFDGRKDFIGGLNTAYSTNLLDNQSPILTNFSTDDKLGLVKRDGYSYADGLPVLTTTKILNAYKFVKDDGSSFLLVHAGSTVFSTSQLGTTWQTVVTGISAKYPFRFATHYNKVFGANGVNTSFGFDGAIYTPYTFIPKAFYPLSADGRLWMGSTVESPSSVYYSEINVDPVTEADWDITVNEQKFGLGDGQVIKGLDFQRGIIWVYKDRSTYGIRSTTNKYLALADYGTVSQFSIGGYSNAKIFLDKSGFYYFGGGNIEYLSDSINNLISGIGVIGANSSRISITSNADFSTGTFSTFGGVPACYNNSGTVEISTSVKTWTTTEDFGNGGAGTTQVNTANDKVKITTSTAGGYQKLSLIHNNFRAGINTNWSEQTGTFGPMPAGGGTNAHVDDNDDTFFGVVYTAGSSEGKYACYNTVSSTDTAYITMPITKIRIRYLNGLWGYLEGGSKKFEVGRSMDYPVTPTNQVKSAGIDLLNAECGTVATPITLRLGEYPGYMVTNVYEEIQTFSAVNTAKIQIWYVPLVSFMHITEADGSKWTYCRALLIFDISAWTGSASSIVNYSSGVYVSSNYTSAGATAQYQFLTVNDSLANKSVTSSDTIKYYANNTGAEPWTYLGLSSGSYTTFPIPSSLDNNTNFYWKAELITSSITATPSISEVSLQYATTNYATYTTKVFSVSSRMTLWGSFVTEDKGTVTYQIRGATWNFGGGEITLGTNTDNAFVTIVNGDDIALSTSSIFIQIKSFLNSKNAKVLGMNLTYSENPNNTGGLQEVSNINIDNRYLFACSTWTTNNGIVLVYNKNRAWEMWDNYPVASFFNFNNNYYFASSTQPIICKMFSGNCSDDAVWKSPHTDFGLPDIDKQIRYAYITTEPKTGSFCQLEYGTDFSTFTKKVFVDLSGITRNKRVEFADGYYGKNFYFTISSTSTIKIEVQHLDIYYSEPYKLR